MKKIHKTKATPSVTADSVVQEATEDSMTTLNQPPQNPNLSRPRPRFDGKAPIMQLEDLDYQYREPEMVMAMIRVGVVTEGRVVRTIKGSMAVDQEADRLRVRHRPPPEHQPRGS